MVQNHVGKIINLCLQQWKIMSHFIVWMITPVVIMVILMMALGVLIFDFLYELFVNLIKSEDDD